MIEVNFLLFLKVSTMLAYNLELCFAMMWTINGSLTFQVLQKALEDITTAK